MSGKTNWKVIKVPEELHKKLLALARKKKKAIHMIIMEAIAFHREQEKFPSVKEDLPMTDKISWYIFKLSSSVGAFKEHPSLQNYALLERTCAQIQYRLGVDTSLILRYAKYLLSHNDPDIRIELNMATKFVIVEILNKHLIIPSKKTSEKK